MQKQQAQSGASDARELALNIVYEITEKGAYANLSLDKALRTSQLPANDKKLVTELVNGTIRMIKHLDWVLALFMQKPLAKQNPWLRNILRISAYQLLFMERIPNYAAVNSAVELTHKKTSRALSGVSNGVLRNLIRNREQIAYPEDKNGLAYLSVYYSQPEWLTQMWLEEFGASLIEKMFQYLNQRAELCLRNNALKNSPEELLKILAEEQVQTRLGPLVPGSIIVESIEKSLEELSAFQQGRFYVQNEASMLAAVILDPQAGEQILDLCCGVGGKSSHFAEKMKNHGQIEAVDLYAHKIKLLQENCQRLGLDIVHAVKRDILNMETKPEWNRVFLDAPCSGLGVLNRRADSRWRKNPADILELSKLQKELLQKASNMVQPGGVLVYATCTINRLENEAVIAEFLEKNAGFHLEEIASLLPFIPLDQKDLHDAQDGFLTLLPGKYNTDGMFYARLRRSTPS